MPYWIIDKPAFVDITDVEYLGLDTTYTVTGSEAQGSLFWDALENTASLVLGNGVVAQIGKEQFIDGENQTETR